MILKKKKTICQMKYMQAFSTLRLGCVNSKIKINFVYENCTIHKGLSFLNSIFLTSSFIGDFFESLKKKT